MAGTVFVGRGSSLAAIASAWQSAAGGSSRWVEVVGEPGVGKTRLLSEAAQRIQLKGGVACWGRATEFEQDSPLAMLVNALDDRIAEDPARVYGRLHEQERRPLAAIFPALSTAVDAADAGSADGAGASRYRLFRAVGSLLNILSGTGGLVLLLDDVHWADAASIDLLGYLALHPPPGRILYMVAYRPAQAPLRLAAALAQLPDRRRLLVEVQPLTPSEVDDLLGPGLSIAHRRWLHEAAGGNPFYLEALARIGEGGVVEAIGAGQALPDAALGEIPQTVRVALCLELERLDPQVDLVARAAAVVGDEFDTATVADAADLPVAVVFAAFDELVRRDIIRGGPASGRFRFRHPLVRHVAYATSQPGWRVATHNRVAARLSAVGAPSTVQAPHLARSAEMGDLQAVTVLADAAAEVAPRAPAVAGGWLQAALDLLADTALNATLRLTLLTRLAQALAVSGQHVAGRDAAREVLRRLPTDSPCRLEVVRTCAVMERHLDNPANARGLLLAELGHVAGAAGNDVLALRLRLAIEDLLAGKLHDAGQTLHWAAQLAGQDDRCAQFAVLALQPIPAYAAGRIDLAFTYAAQACRLMDCATDQEIAAWLDNASWLCLAELLLGHYSDGLRRLGRTLGIARATGQTYLVTPLLNAHARALGRLGRLTRAIEFAEEAAEMSRLQDFGQSRAIALGQQILLHSWTGDYTRALDVAERVTRLGQDMRQWWGAVARSAVAIPLIYTGQVDRMHEVVSATCAEYEAMAVDQVLHLTFCEAMADAEATRGQSGRAQAWADRAARTAHPACRYNRPRCSSSAHTPAVNPIRSKPQSSPSRPATPSPGWTSSSTPDVPGYARAAPMPCPATDRRHWPSSPPRPPCSPNAAPADCSPRPTANSAGSESRSPTGVSGTTVPGAFPPARSRWPGWLSRDAPTSRSPNASSSASGPSKLTFPGSSPSSTYPTG